MGCHSLPITADDHDIPTHEDHLAPSHLLTDEESQQSSERAADVVQRGDDALQCHRGGVEILAESVGGTAASCHHLSSSPNFGKEASREAPAHGTGHDSLVVPKEKEAHTTAS